MIEKYLNTLKFTGI